MSPRLANQMHLLRHAPGSEFIAVIGACSVGGWLLGRWLGWPLAGGLIGFALGFAAGLYRLIRQAFAWQKEIERQLQRSRQQQEDMPH